MIKEKIQEHIFKTSIEVIITTKLIKASFVFVMPTC